MRRQLGVVCLPRIKVHELAKELSLESKDILAQLRRMGVDAKTHMSTISEKDANAVRGLFAKGKAGADGFVPRVKRIPRAVIEQEQAAMAAAAGEAGEEKPEPAAEQVAPPLPAQAEISKSEPSAQPATMPSEGSASVSAAERAVPPAAAAEQPPVSSVAEKAAPTQEQERKPVQEQEQKASATPEKTLDIPKISPVQPVESPAAEQPTKRDEKTALAEEPGQQTASALPQDMPQTRTEVREARAEESMPAKPVEKRLLQEQQDGSHPSQEQRDGSNRSPQGQRDGNRPPQGQRDGNRPPQGQRDGNRPPQGQRDGNRPPQGQRDGNRPPQGQRDGNRPPRGGKPAAEVKFTPTEKPTSNYRPNNNKKVFVKDMVFEKAAEAENRSKGLGKIKVNKPGKGKNAKGKKEVKMVMPPVTPKKITIGETVILGELAKTMGKTAGEVIKKLFTMGIMATINQELDADTAILVAEEFGVTVEVRTDRAQEILEDVADDEKDMVERPPVVTIMGHVDHGKTSLLDAIRHTNVVSGEAGGITQHIGAYQVEIKGKKITFLDTPGHEAFTAMRARGANMTDIAIIVVAADDGVMPQTVEAINHSKAAGVPIIIAINKIDKPGANPDRVKQELMEHGLVSEEWGGDTIMVPVSAKARQNIEGLLEMILLVAEVAELKANPDRAARGAVVEAKLDKNRGPVATLLVQKGTLHAGDNILAGAVFGKVRAMFDDKGRKAKSAGPSTPIEVLGFSEVPPAGEVFIVVKDEKDARLVAAKQQVKHREETMRKTSRVSLDDLFQQIAEGEIKELNLVVKADVQGSVEALTQSLVKLNTDEVRVNVIHAGVGGVSESDVMLASASNAIIIGFNIVAPPAARAAAEAEEVDIRLYRVIYDCIEDIKKAMSGLLAPEYKENIIGNVQVRQVIRVPKVGAVAGSYVTSGKVTRNANVRVIRNSVVVAEDKISSLRRFKDDVKEVLQGFECGIGLESFNDIKEGDELEVFVMEEIAREI